jgi:hypothetical protein
VTCASTVRSVTNSRVAMARLDMPPATSPRRRATNRRVDDRFPVHDPPEGVDDGGDVEHPFLEQIPGPFGMILYEPHGIARFDVLGQDQADLSQQGLAVFRLGDDLDPRVPQQPDDPSRMSMMSSATTTRTGSASSSTSA